ncbi:hypothetical protein J5N97_000519 [Dioscorea zingiberensis]|uniref:Pentatricopeptide repeat-containing protein n=1 Tax=Dioscorea zingiberensis TaxID=325984 RepID=A0A9D5H1I5_9LILI|nr:hypothetical protein J5N97_000519 [Dioscorea zingiberensis]
MDEAFELFERMPQRNVVSWSTLVSGYSKVGDMGMARMMFDRMPFKNLVPWTIIISGYAQKGLAKEAIMLYDQMERDGLKLDDGAVISILAACAESGACRMHNDLELAEEALDQLVKLEPSDPGNFSIVSNMYAAAGDWENMANMRLQMRSIGVQKTSGASSIEVE